MFARALPNVPRCLYSSTEKIKYSAKKGYNTAGGEQTTNNESSMLVGMATSGGSRSTHEETPCDRYRGERLSRRYSPSEGCSLRTLGCIVYASFQSPPYPCWIRSRVNMYNRYTIISTRLHCSRWDLLGLGLNGYLRPRLALCYIQEAACPCAPDSPPFRRPSHRSLALAL